MNIRGKGLGGINSYKFQNLHLYMKQNKIALLLIQEAHMTTEEAIQLEGNYARLRVFASPTPGHETQRGGLAFLLNTDIVPAKDVSVTAIIPGRAAQITIPWQNDRPLTALNIYAPADRDSERTEFFKSLDSAYENNNALRRPTFMAGDFNMVEEGYDRSSNDDSDARVVNAFCALKLRLRLQDTYRNHFPDKRTYTWRRPGSTEWSRIDRTYLNVDLLPYLHTTTIEPTSIDSDHLLVLTEIERPDAPQLGTGVWSLPLELLKNPAANEIVDTLLNEAELRLRNLPERTDIQNPQTILRDLKADIQSALREYDKKKKPSDLESEIRDLAEARRVLIDENALGSSELTKLDSRLKTLLGKRDARHKAQVKAAHFVKGRHPGKYSSAINKPSHPRDIFTSLQKIEGAEASAERDVRHTTLRDSGIPNQAPPRPSDHEHAVRQRELERGHTHVIHSEQIAEEMAIFHILLQQQDTPESPEAHEKAIQDALQFIPNTLSAEESQSLDKTVTLEDLANTLKLTKSDSSPGADGLPYEFWKHFHDRATNPKRREAEAPKTTDPLLILEAAFRDIEVSGYCTLANLNEGLLCPIHKKGPKDLPQNYRPITLLNTDYKLYTKWKSLLLASVISNLVPDDQTGFIPKRSIFDNVALARTVIAHGEAFKDNDGCIVLLDQEKAYDKIDLDYLWKVVRAYNIPEQWIQPVEALYAESSSRVILNGVLSQPFTVHRGVRQGDPLSCLLFVLAIDPLAEMLRRSELRGIDSPDGANRLIANLFADDTTVFLHSSDSFAALEHILQCWCKASRARFNIAKTSIVPFGSPDYRQRVITTRRLNRNSPPIAQSIEIVKDGDATRLLGGRIGNKLSPDTIWNPTLNKLETRMAFWSARDRYPDLWMRKMFSDWLPAGMTQYLAACQDMPPSIIKRVNRLQISFIWKGATHHTVNEETLYRPKTEGGMGIISLGSRITAIHIMRLKAWLAAEKRPRWATFAIKLMGKTLAQNQPAKIHPNLRLNPFTQTWNAPTKPDLTAHWPPELKAMMDSARTQHVSLEPIAPAQSLRETMPVWYHKGLYPERVAHRVDMWEVMKYSNSKCLINNHHIQTMRDLYLHTESRDLPEEDEQHRDDVLCTCAPCVHERHTCDDPSICFNMAEILRDVARSTRWDPAYPDPILYEGPDSPLRTRDAPAGGTCPPCMVPRPALAGPTVGHAIRAFGPVPPENKTDRAARESLANYMTEEFLNYAAMSPAQTQLHEPVHIGSKTTHSPEAEYIRVGAVLFPERLDDDYVFRLAHEREAGRQMTYPENDPHLPLIISTLWALEATPDDVCINLHTTSAHFANTLTHKKRHHEDSDFLDLTSAEAWRTLFATIDRRPAPTQVTLSRTKPSALAYMLHDALDEDPTDFSTLILGDELEPWKTRGIPLAKASQKLLYRHIRRDKGASERRATTVRVAMATHAALDHNGTLPSAKQIWLSTRNPSIPTNDQELLWKLLHDAYKVGDYWARMTNPDMYERRRCHLCGDDLESMEHVLTECEESGQEEVWQLAKELWNHTGHAWPEGHPYGIILAAGILQFKFGKKRDKPSERLFVIIVAAAVRTIWNARCQRAMQEKVITKTEMKKRWRNEIERRLDLDCRATSAVFTKHAHKRKTVKATWDKVIDNEKTQTGDWVRTVTGVLVGSLSVTPTEDLDNG